MFTSPVPIQSQSVAIYDSNDTPVSGSPFTTNSSGLISRSLPPGEYKVIISPLTGYSFASGSLVEDGVSQTDPTSLTVLGITVATGKTTSVTALLTQNT